MSDGEGNRRPKPSMSKAELDLEEYERRRQRIEPLREELYDFLDESSTWRFIRHPFCNQPVPDLDRCGWIHDMIDRWAAKADACFENQDWEGYIACVEIHSQAEWLAKDAYLIPDDRYWSLLRCIYDNQLCHRRNKDLYDTLFRADRPGRENLMTPEEQDVLARLPETMTVYRGYANEDDDLESYANGIAWTLDRRAAVWYANQYWEAEDPRLITGKVKKSNVWAYRGEGELLLPPEAVYARNERYAWHEEARVGWDEFIRTPFDVRRLLKP